MKRNPSSSRLIHTHAICASDFGGKVRGFILRDAEEAFCANWSWPDHDGVHCGPEMLHLRNATWPNFWARNCIGKLSAKRIICFELSTLTAGPLHYNLFASNRSRKADDFEKNRSTIPLLYVFIENSSLMIAALEFSVIAVVLYEYSDFFRNWVVTCAITCDSARLIIVVGKLFWLNNYGDLVWYYRFLYCSLNDNLWWTERLAFWCMQFCNDCMIMSKF